MVADAGISRPHHATTLLVRSVPFSAHRSDRLGWRTKQGEVLEPYARIRYGSRGIIPSPTRRARDMARRGRAVATEEAAMDAIETLREQAIALLASGDERGLQALLVDLRPSDFADLA